MRYLCFSLAVFFYFSAFSRERKIMNVPAFTSISAFGSIDIELVTGNSDSIWLESESVAIENVSVKTEGNILKLSLKQKIFDKYRNVKVYIAKTKLNGIKMSGGAEVSSALVVKSDSLELAARNGGNITLHIESTKIIADIGEGSTISIEGKCGFLQIDASSGGLFSGYEMKAEEAVIKANAGATIKVYATQKLDAYASTVGEVSYRGVPKKLSERRVLGGKIEKLVE